MIPTRLGPEVKSLAERQIFNWMSQIKGSDWVVALHSVNLSEHRWKSMGEIDFLLIGPRGIYVLEIKGGRVARQAGVWEFTDRYGQARRRREGPFEQARGAMFSLRDRLEEMVPEVRTATIGYAVLLPDCELAVESVEWDDAMIVDRSKLERPDGLRRSLGAMATYWTDKRRHPVRMDRSLIERVVAAVRPDFETVTPLHSLSRSIEHELIRLTENQFRALDALAASPRVLFEGGAGTGKTLLAVEACRRASASGFRVLYTCTSPYIAAHVQADAQMAAAEVETLDRLDEAQLGPYDLLVVDEAQDVMTYEDLGLLDRLLAGGLDEGRWLMFMDSNNQRGLVGGYDQEAMDYLMSFRPALYTLSDNCRNTREIVAATQRMTGADVGVTTAGSGPAVCFIDADPKEGVASVVGVLTDLKDQGIDLADVTLLSGEEFGQSCFSRLPSKWRFLIDHLDLSATARRPSGRLGFARISDFKGLESPFVIAETTGGADADAEHRRSLYVGMTRARIGLWIVGDDGGDSGAGVQHSGR